MRFVVRFDARTFVIVAYFYNMSYISWKRFTRLHPAVLKGEARSDTRSLKGKNHAAAGQERGV